MFILEFVVYDLLGEASLLVGLMALIGLLIQKKSAAQVISGTIKTRSFEWISIIVCEWFWVRRGYTYF